MAETIRVADSYALGDLTQPMFDEAEGSRGGYQNNNNVGYRGNGPSFQNKRKDEMQDYRYGPTQVHSIEEEDGAGSSQRQRNDSQWPAKLK
jgi:hypothetical protein